MSEFYSDSDNSSIDEACRRLKASELLTIDWAVQARGMEMAYRQTGDIDYELARVEAQEKARQQHLLFEGCKAILQSLE